MPLKLVILGKQGSGKGTQCDLLVERYQVVHISTGDMLRAAVAQGTPLGLQAKEVMAAGDLVSDELILGLVRERLAQSDVLEHGFLLDGFPRTAAQAQGLLEILDQSEPAVAGPDPASPESAIDLVVDLSVPDEVVAERMRGRGREDDTPDAIARRLALYETETAPLRTFFAEKFSLATIDGLGTPPQVHERINEAIKSEHG